MFDMESEERPSKIRKTNEDGHVDVSTSQDDQFASMKEAMQNWANKHHQENQTTYVDRGEVDAQNGNASTDNQIDCVGTDSLEHRNDPNRWIDSVKDDVDNSDGSEAEQRLTRSARKRLPEPVQKYLDAVRDAVESTFGSKADVDNGSSVGDEDSVDLQKSQSPGADAAESSTKPISKNQLKKQRRKEQWEAGREDRKAKRKEKNKEKKERKREGRSALTEEQCKPKKQKSVQLPITFLVDCGFDDLMTENEMVSLASQVTRCYSDNSKALFRAHYAISSFNGNLKKRFETVLSNHHQNWRGVKFCEEDFVEASVRMKDSMSAPEGGELKGCFLRDAEDQEQVSRDGEVVYLTSDSPNTLEKLKPYSTYIIGGLVDRNRHKGICYKRAMEKGIKTAKLPIGEYMEMNSRFILATNHVFEIMINWLANRDWSEAFMAVMPKRKGGSLKNREEIVGTAGEHDELPEVPTAGPENEAIVP